MNLEMSTIKFSEIRRFTCFSHGIEDKLPCPWPGCKNGSSDDNLELVFPSLDHTGRGLRFKRHEWHDTAGEPYYSWRYYDETANRFDATKTVWSEYRRRKKASEDEQSDLIYHYTSLEGLIGIVQEDCLWLTDYSYLNDPKELVYGSDLIETAIKEMIPHASCDESKDILESWQENISDWIELRESSPIRVCLASFSSLGDDLSQWRSYGMISIGFCPQKLKYHANGAILNEVIYDRPKQLKLAKLYLHHILSSCLEGLKHSNEPGVLSSMYKDIEILVELMAFVKHSSYTSEREVRLIYAENINMASFFPDGKKSKKFRVSGERIIPYMHSTELASSDLEKARLKSAIKEVVIGPSIDPLVYRGIRDLLSEHDLSDVHIKNSTIPYRT
jgi:hypothetical protein